jgi:transposase
MRKTYTQEERVRLLENKHVKNCTENSITYSPAFKALAVKQYAAGLGAQEIFVSAGFDLQLIGRKKPKWLLRDWNKLFQDQGPRSLEGEARGRVGGRPKTKDLTDQEKIKHLEAKVAYLKAENDFLAKFRAKRKE